MQNEKGWKLIPIPLKVLAVLMVLWALGTVMNMPSLSENGLPLLGTFVYGAAALSVAIFLDIIGPVVFLYGLWNRKSWSVKWAFFYIGLFIINSLFALFTVSEQLGLPQILIPTVVSATFLAVIYWQRAYFTAEETLSFKSQ